MKTIIFILAMIMPDGSLSLDTIPVKECPEKGAFFSMMEEAKGKGEIKDWDAHCVEFPAPTKGQDV